MINSSAIGIRTEGRVLAALLEMGKNILLPFGSGARYDLAFDENGILVRVQCKTGKIVNGRLVYNSRSLGRDGMPRHYEGEIDFFGVYSPELQQVYLVPVDIVARGKGSLRIEPSLNNQQRGITWADQFKVP